MDRTVVKVIKYYVTRNIVILVSFSGICIFKNIYIIVQRVELFYLYTKKRLRVLLTQALLRKSLYQLTRLMQHLKSATPPYKGALRG